MSNDTAEGFKMTEARRWDNSEWPEWLNRAWNMPIGETGALWCDTEPPHTFLHISTDEGVVNVQWGDMILSVHGELKILER